MTPISTRRSPLIFTSAEKAVAYSESHNVKVWADIIGHDGVWEIFPGGRKVWYNTPAAPVTRRLIQEGTFIVADKEFRIGKKKT